MLQILVTKTPERLENICTATPSVPRVKVSPLIFNVWSRVPSSLFFATCSKGIIWNTYALIKNYLLFSEDKITIYNILWVQRAIFKNINIFHVALNFEKNTMIKHTFTVAYFLNSLTLSQDYMNHVAVFCFSFFQSKIISKKSHRLQ